MHKYNMKIAAKEWELFPSQLIWRLSRLVLKLTLWFDMLLAMSDQHLEGRHVEDSLVELVVTLVK